MIELLLLPCMQSVPYSEMLVCIYCTCKSGNFRENLISRIALKDIGLDLHISVIDSDFARILYSRNFAYAKFREIKTSAKIFEFTVLIHLKASQTHVL